MAGRNAARNAPRRLRHHFHPPCSQRTRWNLARQAHDARDGQPFSRLRRARAINYASAVRNPVADSPRAVAGRRAPRANAAHRVQHCWSVPVLPLCRSCYSKSAQRRRLRINGDRAACESHHPVLARIDQSALVQFGFAKGGKNMSWIALKMLTGNRGKYLGIILGIAFASLLIAQQASIFCGLMLQTSGQIRDIQGASIWVMDPNVQFSDDVKPLSENDLYRVRGVSGVSWAVRLYKGLTRSRLEDGNFQQTILLGLDDATLVGG